MDIMSYVLIAIVVCVILFAKMALVIIPQSETKIVERLGRYYATLKPGINIIIPFIDRAKSIVVLNHGRYQYSTTIDLREQVYDFPTCSVIRSTTSCAAQTPSARRHYHHCLCRSLTGLPCEWWRHVPGRQSSPPHD